ncbi:helix-turn-helix domain-containing protein [Streptomyces sp. NPDC059411]|uniref:helix-turn-helix domain-containing protein n=1 Tax=Streptomyces sp. NPDC059411 TaxID=3346825 RepID=UPI0036A01F01
MTQGELATAIGRTASWLSQVERGIQPVNRLDVLRLLADGLGVPLQVLQPDAPPRRRSRRRPNRSRTISIRLVWCSPGTLRSMSSSTPARTSVRIALSTFEHR